MENTVSVQDAVEIRDFTHSNAEQKTVGDMELSKRAAGFDHSNGTIKKPTFPSHYNMVHKKRGMALIFNHEHFDIRDAQSRTGTNVDCINLKIVLKKLGFCVSVFHNLVLEELNRVIYNTSKMDHTHHDCLLICILSHGEPGILYAKDAVYKSHSLWNSFTEDQCPSLAGKPKIFFIQACRGTELDGGILVRSQTQSDGASSPLHGIPVHADFLISYSTVPGYYSWRNTTKGSWFIQAVTDELREHGNTEDLLTLLTFVSQRVAYDFQSNVPSSPLKHQQKQIPCTTSTLTKLVLFNDKKENNICKLC